MASRRWKTESLLRNRWKENPLEVVMEEARRRMQESVFLTEKER